MFSNDEMCFTFLAKCRMLDLRNNYKGSYKKDNLHSQVCLDPKELDNQIHLIHCKILSDNQVLSDNINYEDLFSQDISKQLNITRILKHQLQKRKVILRQRNH